MKNYQEILMCLFVAGFVSACGTRENMQIPQTFLSKPDSIVIAQLSGLEEPEYYQSGSQGLAEIAISRMMTDSMRERISQIDAKPITEDYYYQRYGDAFKAKAFYVTTNKNPISKKALTSFYADDNKHASFDFR